MLRIITTAFLALAVAGCGSGDGTVPVTGTVTFDGAPIGDGTDAVIRFEPKEKSGNSAESFLTAGNYTAKLIPGSYAVSVRWSKGSGKKRAGAVAGPGSEGESVVQMIPEKYNTKTELTCTVSKDAAKHDFKLVK